MDFDSLRTRRLLLRSPRLTDLDVLARRRNDPLVAQYQDWTLPYSRQSARRALDEAIAAAGPKDEHWFMITVADPADTEVLGDLAVHLSNGARTAEIGYTFDPQVWGRGYAVEAAEAVVTYLFETVGVSRVAGRLHPDNIASAQVLERIGMTFEGHTRLSHWLGDQNSDDWIYAITRADWEDWQSRPVTAPARLDLVEIDEELSWPIVRLRTHKSQERFVAPMLASYADALFPEVIDGAPVVPWMRGVHADDEWVGFVMLALTTSAHPEPYLWRLLVDRRHQRRGIGRRILDEVVQQCRAWGDTSLLTSWVEGRGSPQPFYERYGFVPTGRIPDDETEGRLLFP